ncbi:DNA cytosine methyltransferase [Candidatus Ventrimonas sp. KK005]
MRLLMPKFVLIENVGGFEKKFVTRPTKEGTISVAEKAIQELQDAGYNVNKVIINAADFILPQLRQRVILFATLKNMLA